MEYDVISTPDLKELCLLVNEKIQEGWRPRGGIATLVLPDRYAVFYQVIIKFSSRRVSKS